MADHIRNKHPRDPNQLGKIIVDISAGDIEDRNPTAEVRGAKVAKPAGHGQERLLWHQEAAIPEVASLSGSGWLDTEDKPRYDKRLR